MNNSKRELVEELVEALNEDELKSILRKVIEEKKAQINRLNQLSLKLSIKSDVPAKSNTDESLKYSKNDSASTAVLKILKGATESMSNSDIREKYSELYDKKVKPSTVGNTLWKGQRDNLFKKVGSGGTRWAKWIYIKQDEEIESK